MLTSTTTEYRVSLSQFEGPIALFCVFIKAATVLPHIKSSHILPVSPEQDGTHQQDDEAIAVLIQSLRSFAACKAALDQLMERKEYASGMLSRPPMIPPVSDAALPTHLA